MVVIRSVVAVLVLGVAAFAAGDAESDASAGARLLAKIIDDCQRRGLVPCLKMKAIAFFDRAARTHEIRLGDAASVVRDAGIPLPATPVATERELEASLPRGSEEARDARLDAILFDRIADFVNGRKLVLTLPKIKPAELRDGVEEGRGKMKKMMSMMMMGFAMKMAMALPMMIALLFLLAGKALIISKIALLLTLIIALKKIIAQKQSHSHEVAWQSSGGGGWDRRSYIIPHSAAHDLAYRGHFNALGGLGKH